MYRTLLVLSLVALSVAVAACQRLPPGPLELYSDLQARGLSGAEAVEFASTYRSVNGREEVAVAYLIGTGQLCRPSEYDILIQNVPGITSSTVFYTVSMWRGGRPHLTSRRSLAWAALGGCPDTELAAHLVEKYGLGSLLSDSNEFTSLRPDEAASESGIDPLGATLVWAMSGAAGERAEAKRQLDFVLEYAGQDGSEKDAGLGSVGVFSARAASSALMVCDWMEASSKRSQRRWRRRGRRGCFAEGGAGLFTEFVTRGAAALAARQSKLDPEEVRKSLNLLLLHSIISGDSEVVSSVLEAARTLGITVDDRVDVSPGRGASLSVNKFLYPYRFDTLAVAEVADVLARERTQKAERYLSIADALEQAGGERRRPDLVAEYVKGNERDTVRYAEYLKEQRREQRREFLADLERRSNEARAAGRLENKKRICRAKGGGPACETDPETTLAQLEAAESDGFDEIYGNVARVVQETEDELQRQDDLWASPGGRRRPPVRIESEGISPSRGRVESLTPPNPSPPQDRRDTQTAGYCEAFGGAFETVTLPEESDPEAAPTVEVEATRRSPASFSTKEEACRLDASADVAAIRACQDAGGKVVSSEKSSRCGDCEQTAAGEWTCAVTVFYPCATKTPEQMLAAAREEYLRDLVGTIGPAIKDVRDVQNRYHFSVSEAPSRVQAILKAATKAERAVEDARKAAKAISAGEDDLVRLSSLLADGRLAAGRLRSAAGYLALAVQRCR